MESKRIRFVIYSNIIINTLTSCNHNETPNEIVDKYQNSSVIMNNDYSTFILPRGKIRIIVNEKNKCNAHFERIFGYAWATRKLTCDENQIWDLVNEMDKLRIVGISNNEKYSLYYSSHSDSSYTQLGHEIKITENFIMNNHKQVELDKLEYRYVFLKLKGISTIPDALRKNNKLVKIRHNWYYYRSFNYSLIDKF